MQIYLPIYELIMDLHDAVLEVSGGRQGILDKNVIYAAIDRPKTYLSYHPDCDVHTACAILLDSLARNHAFVEGNKRTALMTVILTYELNDVVFKFTGDMNKEYENLVLKVVLEKPAISDISESLRDLAAKYSSSGTSSFAQKVKVVLKPFTKS